MITGNKQLEKAEKAFTEKEYTLAESLLIRTINTEWKNPHAHHLLGLTYFTTGRIKQAITHLSLAAANDKNNPQILYNQALVLMESGEYSHALQIFNKVLTLIPKHLPSLTNCSVILGKIGNVKMVERICQLITRIDSRHPETFNNLGNAYKDQGLVEKALTCYQQALTLKPDFYKAASNLLMGMNYREYPGKEVYREHKKWEQRLPSRLTIQDPFSQSRPLDKKIRIGYVSADLRTHSVGYFIEPILFYHNKKEFDIFCYADMAQADTTSKRLQSAVTTWRLIYKLDNSLVEEMIRNDNIDILVDLAGHTGDNRLTLFLKKPAPIQVTYLGYPNTTGLSTMDYRFTDSWADPQEHDRFYTEKLYRLSPSFLCYKPPAPLPPVNESPVTSNRYITFGSFNALPKLSPDCLATWIRILHQVSDSKLIIKTKPFNDYEVKEYYKNLFTSRGIGSDRLLFLGYNLSLDDHLKSYYQVDIALDTFPYNGTTTTCESLIMGVPVITLIGSNHAGRVGNSILNSIGLKAMIAVDKNTYINIAVSLANNIEQLQRLRKSNRDRLFHSILCAHQPFTKQIEKAYKKMYHTHYYKSKFKVK